MSLAPHLRVPEMLAGRTSGTVVALPAATVHHLRRALRLVDGSVLSVTDGIGAVAPAELVVDGARLTAVPAALPPMSPRIVLVQSLAKGRRVDDAVRMACELGVDHVVPLVADRTQGRPDAGAAAAVVGRWQAIAGAALEQSRGAWLTTVAACCSTAQLAASPHDAGSDVRLVAVPGAPALPDVLAGCQPEGPAAGQRGAVWVAVGPEGGFSAAEVELLSGSGWLAVGLGPTVLRTEHAGPVAVAVLAALSGRWRGPSRGPGASSG